MAFLRKVMRIFPSFDGKTQVSVPSVSLSLREDTQSDLQHRGHKKSRGWLETSLLSVPGLLQLFSGELLMFRILS